MKQLFIAWVPFQRRTVSLQEHFGFELEFITTSFKWRFLRSFEYLFKSSKTLALLIGKRPDVVWLQLPPTVMLYLSYLYQKLLKPQAIIVADCHNATFRHPWIKFPKIISLLNQCDLVLVHSKQIETQAKALGVAPQKVCLLEDPPTTISQSHVHRPLTYRHPWVLCPCSFNRDEPIKELLEAAQLAPEVTFVITGNTSRAKGIHDLRDVPENVDFPGFLPIEDFNSLLLQTDIVLGLTKLDGIQLSVAVEATGTATPMVLSNTALLQKLFYKGAIFVNSESPDAIAQGCQEAFKNHRFLTEEVAALKEERKTAWLSQTEEISRILRRANDSLKQSVATNL